MIEESKRCDKMRHGGDYHCGHIEEGKPCCQCGYVREEPKEASAGERTEEL